MLPDDELTEGKHSISAKQIIEPLKIPYSVRLESKNSQLIHHSDQNVRYLCLSVEIGD